MTSMPAHLQRALIAAGDLTTDRVTRTARRRRCSTCAAWCWAVIPEYETGAAWVTLHSTNNEGEFMALMSGRVSYDLNADKTLTRRDAWEIARRPADVAPHVHVTHECGTVDTIHGRDKNHPPLSPSNSFTSEPEF